MVEASIGNKSRSVFLAFRRPSSNLISRATFSTPASKANHIKGVSYHLTDWIVETISGMIPSFFQENPCLLGLFYIAFNQQDTFPGNNVAQGTASCEKI